MAKRTRKKKLLLDDAVVVDVEKVKLQIFYDSVKRLVEEAPPVLVVCNNPLLYGEFINTLKRSLT